MADFHHDERLLFGTAAGVFVLLTAVIAIGPALQVQSAQEPLPNSEPMTERQRRGLQVYVDEGCAYCHTQQVRPVPSDEAFGRPSVAADYARLQRPGIWRQTPAVLGSQRTGPDLSNVAERQPSKQWHYLHLYNPRTVVSDSMMPAFPWLFRVEQNPAEGAAVVSVPTEDAPEGGKVVPTDRARALVAYLLSLEQTSLPGRTQAGAAKSSPEQSESKSNGGPDGAALYESTCATCHQSSGKGVPGAFPPLADDPVVTAEDPTRHVEIVLDGLQGKTIEGTSYSTAMPGFGDRLSDAEVAAVVNHERTSWGNAAPKVGPEEVAEIRRALESSESKGED